MCTLSTHQRPDVRRKGVLLVVDALGGHVGHRAQERVAHLRAQGACSHSFMNTTMEDTGLQSRPACS
eukprot:scaffold100013_cov22-Tisochrysis_lutea.AAC.1